MSSDLEAAMVAVERVNEYCAVDTEAARFTDADNMPCWPSAGKIDFREVKLRYRPGLPLVLKGLSIEIPGGSKVGVVGRTGKQDICLLACSAISSLTLVCPHQERGSLP